MWKKVILATIILYGVQVWLLSMAQRADADRCKGWSCPAIWCPDTYSIRAPGGTYVECEKLEQYLKETGL